MSDITSAPRLTGRDIGSAERATRALLERLLDAEGVPFADWTVVFTIGTDGPQPRDALVARQVDGLKVTTPTGAATVDRVVAAGLAGVGGDRPGAGEPGAGDLALTPQGRALYERVSAGIATIAAELYGDLPEADLDATRRTLAEVTRRANARLAATG